MADLLHRRDQLLTEVVIGRNLHAWFQLTLVMTLCASAYGAILGLWHGPRLALYVAIKFPLVLLITSTLTMLLSWMAAVLMGLPLRLAQVGALTFLGLSVASVLLASLAPVAWFFTLCAPAPTEDARTTHNLLYLMHTGFVGGCGLAGTLTLWQTMRKIDAPVQRVRVVYLFWVATYALWPKPYVRTPRNREVSWGLSMSC